MDVNNLIGWGTLLGILLGAYNIIRQILRDRQQQPISDYQKALEMARQAAESVRLLSDRVGKLETIQAKWRRGIGILIKQLVDHQIEPAWQPENESEGE